MLIINSSAIIWLVWENSSTRPEDCVWVHRTLFPHERVGSWHETECERKLVTNQINAWCYYSTSRPNLYVQGQGGLLRRMQSDSWLVESLHLLWTLLQQLGKGIHWSAGLSSLSLRIHTLSSFPTCTNSCVPRCWLRWQRTVQSTQIKWHHLTQQKEREHLGREAWYTYPQLFI